MVANYHRIPHGKTRGPDKDLANIRRWMKSSDKLCHMDATADMGVQQFLTRKVQIQQL